MTRKRNQMEDRIRHSKEHVLFRRIRYWMMEDGAERVETRLLGHEPGDGCEEDLTSDLRRNLQRKTRKSFGSLLDSPEERLFQETLVRNIFRLLFQTRCCT